MVGFRYFRYFSVFGIPTSVWFRFSEIHIAISAVLFGYRTALLNTSLVLLGVNPNFTVFIQLRDSRPTLNVPLIQSTNIELVEHLDENHEIKPFNGVLQRHLRHKSSHTIRRESIEYGVSRRTDGNSHHRATTDLAGDQENWQTGRRGGKMGGRRGEGLGWAGRWAVI